MRAELAPSAYKLFGHDAKPRGAIIHLKKAKDFLAPFRKKAAGGSIDQLSEEVAEQEIKEIAAIYNANRLQAATAPRLNAPREMFAALAAAADQLHGLMSRMGDIERVMYEGSGQSKEIPRKLYLQAKGNWLPRSSLKPVPDTESKWLIQLSAFADWSRKLLTIYNQRVGADVGGRINVHKHFFNSPEYVLIQHGWHLFERHKPGKATTSEKGAFHLFLQQIYEYATNKGANEVGAPALLPKIKEMLKPLRDYERNIEYLKAAEELETLFLKRLMKGASEEELESLIQELKDATAKIDPNAGLALRVATTRRRSRR